MELVSKPNATAAVWDSNRMTVVNHLTCVSRYVTLVVKRQKLNASIQQTCICTYNIIIQCSFPSCEKKEKTEHGTSPSSRQSTITAAFSRQSTNRTVQMVLTHNQCSLRHVIFLKCFLCLRQMLYAGIAACLHIYIYRYRYIYLSSTNVQLT